MKDPPAEYEYIADPPSISAFDLDIVRLTALFAAKNGRTFINHIMNKEARFLMLCIFLTLFIHVEEKNYDLIMLVH